MRNTNEPITRVVSADSPEKGRIAMNEKNHDLREIEVEVFDEFVKAKREGRNVDVRRLVERLPVESREEFLQLLTTTDKMQTAAAAIRESLSGEVQRGSAEPVIVHSKNPG
jgi:hypothetical protein